MLWSPVWGMRYPYPCITVRLPRMLPGFVKSYQVREIGTRRGRRNTRLTLFIPLWGSWHTSRTRALK